MFLGCPPIPTASGFLLLSRLFVSVFFRMSMFLQFHFQKPQKHLTKTTRNTPRTKNPETCETKTQKHYSQTCFCFCDTVCTCKYNTKTNTQTLQPEMFLGFFLFNQSPKAYQNKSRNISGGSVSAFYVIFVHMEKPRNIVGCNVFVFTCVSGKFCPRHVSGLFWEQLRNIFLGFW
jgi:hypothetical protein